MQNMPTSIELNQSLNGNCKIELNEQELIIQPYFFNSISTEEAEALLRDKIKRVSFKRYLLRKQHFRGFTFTCLVIYLLGLWYAISLSLESRFSQFICLLLKKNLNLKGGCFLSSSTPKRRLV